MKIEPKTIISINDNEEVAKNITDMLDKYNYCYFINDGKIYVFDRDHNPEVDSLFEVICTSDLFENSLMNLYPTICLWEEGELEAYSKMIPSNSKLTIIEDVIRLYVKFHEGRLTESTEKRLRKSVDKLYEEIITIIK